MLSTTVLRIKNIKKPELFRSYKVHPFFFISLIFSLYFIFTTAVYASSDQNEQALPFTLVGTITGNPPLALLALDDKKLHFYTLKDKIGNFTITAIEKNKINLSYNKRIYTLHLQQKTALVALPVPAADLSSKQAANLPINIHVKRQLLNHISHNIQQWLAAIPLKLEITDGRVSGYAVGTVQNIPLNSAIGLQRGDIIKSINGVAVSQSRLFAETTNNLIDRSDIYIKIERDHKLSTLHFSITD